MNTKNSLILASLACFGSFSALALQPEVDYSARFMSIDNVERTPGGTRIDVTLKHRPHYWVMVDSAVVLTDASTGRTFRLIGHENISPSAKIWMPDSGHHQGKLFFESIPEDVKVVDMLVPDEEDVFAYGIHLDEQRIAVNPTGMSKDDILARAPHPEKWSGLSPAKYRDMEFVRPGATALVNGHIDHYLPKIGFRTLSVTTDNEITDKDYKTVGDIDSLGNFSLVVPVDYSQMATIKIGDFYNSIFLTPGDTFDIHTTTTGVLELKPYPRNVPEYFNISGSNQDAVDISLLLRDVDSRLVTDNYDWKRIKKVIEGGLDSVMVANADIKNIMSGFVSTAPGEIDRYPVSPYAKDILYTYALVNNYLPMEDIAMYWRDKRALTQGEGADRRRVSNPDYKEIDTDIYYGGQQEYASLLYDNPLVLCENGSLVNRCKFSQLFGPFGVMSSGTLHIEPIDGGIVVDSLSVFEEGESRYGRIKAYEKDWLGKMDLMGCFMEQLLVAGELSDKVTGYRELTPDWLATTSVYVSELLPLVNHKMLISSVLDSWGKTNREAGRMESGVSEGNSRSVDTQSNILAEVINPYLGNVIYVDVWGIGCGPCRAAMLQQKELIRHYEGQPLTVIYLAGEDEKEQCERWMRENDIKGEHVYLSPDNKERFYGDFNIVGIPFGILIDKKGNVVDTKLHSIYIRDGKLESLLNE